MDLWCAVSEIPGAIRNDFIFKADYFPVTMSDKILAKSSRKGESYGALQASYISEPDVGIKEKSSNLKVSTSWASLFSPGSASSMDTPAMAGSGAGVDEDEEKEFTSVDFLR